MKLKQQFITLLAIGLALALPLLTHAQTFSQDGVNYEVTSGTSVKITGVDPNATSLVIRKNLEYNGTPYTTEKIENGKIVSANATTVTFDGPWALESNISGTQFYNLSAVEKYEVTNPNTNTGGSDPETGENMGRLEAGTDGILYMWHSNTEIHLVAYPCKKTEETYNMPANVTNIQASAFRNNTYLKTINLNSELRLIRNEAFAGCTNLTAINAGAGNPYFQTVGGVLFQIGTMQNGDLSKFYPAGVTYHKTLAAYPAGLPAISYEVPADVVILARSCFYGATNLKEVTFASGTALQEIREFAFNKCENLETLIIPATVQYINMAYADAPINPMGTGAQVGSVTYDPSSVNKKVYAATAQGTFNHCKKLKLAVDPKSPYFKVEDDVLFSKDGTRLVRYGCTKTFPGYIVPRNVTWIDSYAFDCTQVAHVVLPSMMTEVSRNMFEEAKNLDFITIPPLVENIRQDAFKDCEALAQVFMMPETPPTLRDANVFGSSNPTIYTKPNGTFNSVARTIYTDYTTAENYPSSDRIKYDIPVTLSSGVGTMCRDFAVQLGSNLTAYYIPNDATVDVDGNAVLTLQNTNISNGKFIPARTGEDYGDYRGVILKTTSGTEGTYQISVEDFANHFGYRGIYQADGAADAYFFSYTFDDRELATQESRQTGSGTDVKAQEGGTISYSKVGGWNSSGTSPFWVKNGNKYYQKFAHANDSKIIIKRTSGSFAAGDKLYITTYYDYSIDDGDGCLYIKSNNTNDSPTPNKIPLVYDPKREVTVCYTLTADDLDPVVSGQNSITLMRGNATTFIRSIQVYSPTKANPIPRFIKESKYIIGTPVETNITVYDDEGVKEGFKAAHQFTNFGLKSGKFQRVAADGMVKCNKAYLHLPNNNVPSKVPGSNEVSSSAKFTLVFKDFVEDEFDNTETTGIQEVNVEARKKADNGIVYNIQGHRVGNADALQQGTLPKGLYILNGKKYIVK